MDDMFNELNNEDLQDNSNFEMPDDYDFIAEYEQMMEDLALIVDELEKESNGKINSYYNNLIQSEDNTKQLHAINRLGWYERICGSLTPKFSEFTEVSEKELASNRIYMYYSANNLFLGNNEIMDNISKLQDIDIIMIHNRLDLICPYKGAYDIKKALPKSKLISVPEFGHIGCKIYKVIKKEFGDILK